MMADMKPPRVNERETRAERFITDCLEARKRDTLLQVFVSLNVYRNKGGRFLDAFPPNLSGEKLHIF